MTKHIIEPLRDAIARSQPDPYSLVDYEDSLECIAGAEPGQRYG